MPNIFGWGNDEPQILPKEQGGDTIAEFTSKIKNLFQSLFNTLNSYPWSNATPTAAGYMSGADKTKLDGLISTDATPTAAGYMSAEDKTNLTALLTNGDGEESATVDTSIMTGTVNYKRFGRLLIVSVEGKLNAALAPYSGARLASGLPGREWMPGNVFPTAMMFFDSSTYYGAWLTYAYDGTIYINPRDLQVPANLQFYGYIFCPITI